MFLHRGSAQAAQLPQSLVQLTQPENQPIAQKLSNFVNSAQCLASPVPKKQQQKQPKTKTVDIESQWQKPLSKHQKLAPSTTPSHQPEQQHKKHNPKNPAIRKRNY